MAGSRFPIVEFPVNVLTPERLKQMLADAEKAQAAADASAQALEKVLHEALCRLVPEGSVIDLRDRQLPSCLSSLKTTHGADRGTHVFRIVRINGVSLRARTPTVSQWSCEAVPISETTGQDMRATAGNSRGGSRTTVTMTGYLSHDRLGDSLDAEMERMIQGLTGAPYVTPPTVPTPKSRRPR